MNSRTTTILFAAVLLGMVALGDKVPAYAYVLLFLIFAAVLVWGSIFISSQFYVPAKFRGITRNKSIAITFDDGPMPGKTERVLEILKKWNVKATFFCIGKHVNAQPELVKRIHEEGHILGNHSYLHGTFFDLQSAAMMKEELIQTNKALYEAAGVQPRFFRPPYGVTNPMLAAAVKRVNAIVVGWTVRSFDTVAKDRSKLLSKITSTMKEGDIILLHDRCEITVDILPDLLDAVEKAGLKVEPLDELISERPYAVS